MVCAPVRSIIPSLKLGDYLSIQAHKSCSNSHLELNIWTCKSNSIFQLFRYNEGTYLVVALSLRGHFRHCNSLSYQFKISNYLVVAYICY